jgi:hypothetical protein
MHRNINVLAHWFTHTCFGASRRHLQGVQCEPAQLLPRVVKAEQQLYIVTVCVMVFLGFFN